MDADETRIITVFGAEEVLEVYKENLLKYRKYLLQHLDRKTILSGREDFPCGSLFRPKRMVELRYIRLFQYLLVSIVPRSILEAKVMPSPTRLHDGVTKAIRQEAYLVVPHPKPLYPAKGVFNPDAER